MFGMVDLGGHDLEVSSPIVERGRGVGAEIVGPSGSFASAVVGCHKRNFAFVRDSAQRMNPFLSAVGSDCRQHHYRYST